MKRKEDLLKEACARLAQEETEALIRSLDEKTSQEAEALFKRHRRKIFALIRENSARGRSKALVYLRAAACLALIAGAVWISLSHQAPAPTPLSPLPTASVAPYMTQAPTASPLPSPSPSPSPTFSPVPTNIPTISPTETPLLTQKPAESSTQSPTFTPIPSSSPSPAPTFSPSPAPQYAPVPQAWTGQYFPKLPLNAVLLQVETGENMLSAAFDLGNGKQVIFSEYENAQLLPVPEGAHLSYIPLHEGLALLIEEEERATLVWEMDGRSFALNGETEEIKALASTVEKIDGK